MYVLVDDTAATETLLFIYNDMLKNYFKIKLRNNVISQHVYVYLKLSSYGKVFFNHRSITDKYLMIHKNEYYNLLSCFVNLAKRKSIF